MSLPRTVLKPSSTSSCFNARNMRGKMAEAKSTLSSNVFGPSGKGSEFRCPSRSVTVLAGRFLTLRVVLLAVRFLMQEALLLDGADGPSPAVPPPSMSGSSSNIIAATTENKATAVWLITTTKLPAAGARWGYGT